MTNQTPPPADRAALRQRIRLAIARQYLYEIGSGRTVDELDDAEFGTLADAVLAVLPEPADRAAVLHGAADHLARQADELWAPGRTAHTVMHADAAELRRMADETEEG
ncbi:hypothetical protein DN402_31555 [Streptomyces sp. SW4]|nr:hypothetical protein DN402_31555 [Streptomyces sp. SW4]